MTTTLDPVTRYVHLTYAVPNKAPAEVVARCSWSPAGRNEWRPASVRPFISRTALNLATWKQRKQWREQGRIVERRAAGARRTVVFNPYPDAYQDGKVEIDFRIRLERPTGEELETCQMRVTADDTDMVCLEDWTKVLQQEAITTSDEDQTKTCTPKWRVVTGQTPSPGSSFGNHLLGRSAPQLQLPQLTCPLDLHGWYALFVCTPSGLGVKLRLSGDDRLDMVWSRHPGQEVFWRWAKLDRQHLVIAQHHAYTGYVTSGLDYVRLVPLTPELVSRLDARFGGPHDKFLAGYWEPYSWAFHEDIHSPLQHREPLTAFAEAGVDLVDMQIGRFGAKVVYESRVTDPLVYGTQGDPIGKVARPTTDNVGRMQQFTNTLQDELRYARELGLNLHANFGASNCYPGSPLQGDFSRTHPDWMRGAMLRFEVPQVQAYVLRLYREALEIGAPGISLDYCRYPETIDTPETGNTMMRKLRALADEFGRQRGTRVPVLVRFPGTGVRRSELFDYPTWIKEELVDYLCPSNIQGRHLHLDMAPYLAAVRGTRCKLLPVVDALGWGLTMPGMFLRRVAELYAGGVEGIYVYQADSRVLGEPADRRCMKMLSSSEAVRRFWQEEEKQRPERTKGIYLTPPSRQEGYHGWERLRVWTEGVEPGPVELFLDGKLVSRFARPPYVLGGEGNEADGVIPRGEHELRVRAKDGKGWLEQTFAVRGA